jgi:hypothetical protein
VIAIRIVAAFALVLVSVPGCVARVDLGAPSPTGLVQTLESGTSDDLLAVHACASGDVWIAGTLGTVLRVRDGVVDAMSAPTRFDLRAILCEPSGRVWAAGDRTTLLSWDGTWGAWSGGPVDISGDPLDYLGLARHDGVTWLLPGGTAYDDGFAAIALRLDGAEWSSTTRVMDHAGGTSLVSGRRGLFVFHDDEHYDAWTGERWERRIIPLSEASSYNLGAAVVGDDATYLAGTDANGDAVLLRVAEAWDVVARDSFDPDQRPTAIARLADRSVVGTYAGDVFVVEDAGAVTRVGRTRRSIRALTTTPGAVWIVGDDGLVARMRVSVD